MTLFVSLHEKVDKCNCIRRGIEIVLFKKKEKEINDGKIKINYELHLDPISFKSI